jgi:hypothetical protein
MQVSRELGDALHDKALLQAACMALTQQVESHTAELSDLARRHADKEVGAAVPGSCSAYLCCATSYQHACAEQHHTSMLVLCNIMPVCTCRWMLDVPLFRHESKAPPTVSPT